MIGYYNVIVHSLCIFQGHKHFLFSTSCEVIDIINYYLYKNDFKMEKGEAWWFSLDPRTNL